MPGDVCVMRNGCHALEIPPSPLSGNLFKADWLTINGAMRIAVAILLDFTQENVPIPSAAETNLTGRIFAAQDMGFVIRGAELRQWLEGGCGEGKDPGKVP